MVGNLTDHGNGFYSQVIRYQCEDRPRAVFKLRGKTVSTFNAFPAHDLAVYAGQTSFDSALNLDDATIYGLRVGWNRNCAWTLGLELGLGDTKDSTTGDSGQFMQVLFNARYQLHNRRMGSVTPYVSGGLGYAFFQDFVVEDEALAAQLSVGGSYDYNHWMTLRVEARALWIDDVYNLGSSTNTQANFIVSFKF